VLYPHALELSGLYCSHLKTPSLPRAINPSMCLQPPLIAPLQPFQLNSCCQQAPPSPAQTKLLQQLFATYLMLTSFTHCPFACRPLKLSMISSSKYPCASLEAT
jgi:hypothetical protein